MNQKTTERLASSGQSTIAATATALPPHTITRADMKYYMGRVFDIPERKVEAMMSIVDNARVDKRHAIFPMDYIVEPRALSKTNEEYMEHAIKLGREAAEKCLERAGLKPTDIDLIITVSCTGFMIPSLDAHLIHLMGFRPNVRRMPFTELGCAAGAMALGRAADYLKARTRGKRPGDRGGIALADVSAQRYFAGEPDFIDSVWRWGGGGGGKRKRCGARAEDPGFGNVYISRLAGSYGI